MSALITQLVTDEPTIITIGFGLPVESRLWLELQRSGAHTQQLTFDLNIRQPEKVLADLQSAYKIVCCVQPATISKAEVNKLISLLSEFQAKTIIVLLVDTAIQFSSKETESITQWRISSDAQEEMIRFLMKSFDRVRMIFCQDSFQIDQEVFLPSWRVLCSDATEIIDPQISVSPCHIEQICSELVQQILLPLPQPSVVLRGAYISSTELLQKVLNAVSVVSMRTVVIRKTTESVRPILPFTTQEIILPAQVNQIESFVEQLARMLPPLPQPKLLPIHKHIVQTTSQPHIVQLPSTPVLEQQYQKPKQASPPTIRKKPHPLINQEVDVSAELQKIFIPERVTETVDRVVKIAKTEKTTKVKGKRKRVLFTGGILAIIVGLLVLLLFGIYTVSVLALHGSLKKSLSQTTIFQPTTTEESYDIESLPSPLLTRFVSFQTQLYGGFLETSSTAHANQYVEIAQILPMAAAELKTTQDAAIALYSFVLGSELGDVEQLSNRLTTAAQNSYELLSKLQAELKTIEISDPTTSVGADVLEQTFTEKLSNIRKTLVIQQQLHTILPQLLGEPTKRTYAVVLQNSQELRPTGGFIQSVALLTFAQGSLISSEVVSSYELDQKLLGSVQPPEEIQRYLGEKQWFLRDSNWDPHFPNSASKIAWFIDQTRGIQVDGVLAFNLESMRMLLESIGPLDVPEYNEVITHKNLLERMEFHSEVVLTAESTQRDYSTVLLEKMLGKMSDLPSDSVVSALSVLQKALAEQEILVALFEEIEGELLTSLGWSGGVVRPACPSQLAQANCIVDFIFPVEANVGVNKANAYIHRSVQHEVVLEASSAAHSHILRLENTAKSNSWPKGAYKNYQRFLLPDSADVTSVTINGELVSPDQQVRYSQQGLSVLGLELSIPIQQQVEVVIAYTIPINRDSEFSYSLFLQKQSGVRDVPTTIKIHSPTGMKPLKIAPAATVVDDVVEFRLEQSEHAFVGIQFK